MRKRKTYRKGKGIQSKKKKKKKIPWALNIVNGKGRKRGEGWEKFRECVKKGKKKEEIREG